MLETSDPLGSQPNAPVLTLQAVLGSLTAGKISNFA